MGFSKGDWSSLHFCRLLLSHPYATTTINISKCRAMKRSDHKLITESLLDTLCKEFCPPLCHSKHPKLQDPLWYLLHLLQYLPILYTEWSSYLCLLSYHCLPYQGRPARYYWRLIQFIPFPQWVKKNHLKHLLYRISLCQISQGKWSVARMRWGWGSNPMKKLALEVSVTGLKRYLCGQTPNIRFAWGCRTQYQVWV
jgi:hypothetical protein